MSQQLQEIDNNRINSIRNPIIQTNMKERKKIFLKEFNSRLNGELADQDWVEPEMTKFHEKMSKLKQFYCENCHELWPQEKNICLQCKKNKTTFSLANDMNPQLDRLPPYIKKLFQELTMVEEMLLSPILTVMSICRLKSGQLLSRGYVANFSQDLTQLCKILPRKTNELPILIVKKLDQNNVEIEFLVNRNRVTTLLNWLYHNNTDWKLKGIEINIENINSLPLNGIPTDLNEISEGNSTPENFDQVIIQTGPNISENNIENDDFIQTFVESDIEEPLQIDRIGQFLTVEWPKANSKPINEFEYDGLCSLAFPAIFPYGTGDPTKNARRFEVSETDGFNHLMKYAAKRSIDNQLYYPFVEHSRFKFWAYDRIRRHRALNQSKIYLKQNIGI